MIDLWMLLVENIAGGFWLAVMLVTFIFFIVLAIFGCSIFDNLTFNMMFLMAMAIGYGYAIITVPLSIFILGWFTFQFISWIERGGSG